MLKFFKKQTKDLSDLELLSRYQTSGNMEVLGDLYQRYMELVYGVCLKILKDRALAEDAVMNIFEELTKKAKKHEISNFKSWLHVLAKNHCLMYLRKHKKMKVEEFSPQLMQLSEEEHPLFEGEENGHMQYLKPCLENLKDKQKQCIDLFYLQGKSYQEISEILGEETKRVRSYIQNGRRNLKICMENKNEKSIKK
ncbi:MAG TPA: sigma-70 family RNA polymerase sigma factor [Saprospiraceae bacterium]|nr:sigma-70 family RNA polymerase sigma factor [Saprospiraceae bacterium]